MTQALLLRAYPRVAGNHVEFRIFGGLVDPDHEPPESLGKLGTLVMTREEADRLGRLTLAREFSINRETTSAVVAGMVSRPADARVDRVEFLDGQHVAIRLDVAAAEMGTYRKEE